MQLLPSLSSDLYICHSVCYKCANYCHSSRNHNFFASQWSFVSWIVYIKYYKIGCCQFFNTIPSVIAVSTKLLIKFGLSDQKNCIHMNEVFLVIDKENWTLSWFFFFQIKIILSHEIVPWFIITRRVSVKSRVIFGLQTGWRKPSYLCL